MTQRYGAPLISGATVYGDAGLGVLGSVVRADTATGSHGPGLLYNDWDGSADDSKEFRALVVTPPAAGTFFVNEDGSFTLTGAPDGTYSATYRLFVDGADLGTSTASFTVGISFSVTATGLASSLAFGSATLTALRQFSLAPSGLPSTLAFGSAMAGFTIGSTFNVVAAGLPSSVAFGASSFSAQRDFTVAATGLPSTLVTGVSTLNFTLPNQFSLSPSGLPSTLLFGSATVSSIRDFVVSSVGRASSAAFGVATVSFTAAEQPAGLTAQELREMYEWVKELALINGLVPGMPVTVQRTRRIVGDVEQSIAGAGTSSVTVSRV